MKIFFIVAMSENHVIGKDGQLPWHLPDDLRYFKKITVGKNILMGRKTFDSIGKALPRRNNFVLTRNKDFAATNVRVFHSKEEVLASGLDELIVIGGQKIYEIFMHECERIYLTLVHEIFSGDVFFPKFQGFKKVCEIYHEKDESHSHSFTFIELERSKV